MFGNNDLQPDGASQVIRPAEVAELPRIPLICTREHCADNEDASRNCDIAGLPGCLTGGRYSSATDSAALGRSASKSVKCDIIDPICRTRRSPAWTDEHQDPSVIGLTLSRLSEQTFKGKECGLIPCNSSDGLRILRHRRSALLATRLRPHVAKDGQPGYRFRRRGCPRRARRAPAMEPELPAFAKAATVGHGRVCTGSPYLRG